ncbi:MAG TPA: DUF4123 domain-containing protein [Isosphaeraceae bacterium]|nr:DUF4123 domain-containing protein [Isosphaeraceae bacterium]
MKLVLHDTSRPETRYRVELTPGTPTTVGRREPASVVIPGDLTMSRRHFALETDGQVCRIRDLNSTGGTYLNARRVSDAEVRDGDQIQAGSTLLQIRFAIGFTSASMPVMHPESTELLTLAPDATLIAPALEDPLHAAVEAYFSTLKEPLFAILDAARDPLIYARLLECEEQYQSLYEGPKGDQLALVAPYLVALPPRSRFLRTLIREGWGQSWGIYCTGSVSFSELRNHLRKLLTVKTEEGKTLLFRFYDPRVLRPFLPTCSRSELTEFFGPIRLFASEAADSAELEESCRDDRGFSQKLCRMMEPQPAFSGK